MPVRRDVVIDTGPLLALAAAGHLQLLRGLFARVIVPSEVVREIEAGGRTQFARDEFRMADWLEKRARETALPPLLQSTLDPGEAAVIAIAASEHVTAVVIDEIVGRRVARLHKLSVTGSLGILLQAKLQGSPVIIRDAIGNMREHGIWLSKTLEQECLKAAGEEPDGLAPVV